MAQDKKGNQDKKGKKTLVKHKSPWRRAAPNPPHKKMEKSAPIKKVQKNFYRVSQPLAKSPTPKK